MKEEPTTSALGAEGSACFGIGATDGMPSGFVAISGNIYEAASDPGVEPSWLCSPIAVTALFRDTSGRGWGRIIELMDPDGRRQEAAIRDSELESRSASVRSRLIDYGLRLGKGARARDAFSRLIREWKPARTMTSTDRLGWTDQSFRSFVLGDGRVRGHGQFHFTGRSLDGTKEAFAEAGTADTWRDNVAMLCAGNTLLILSVSLAFTGPLLELLNEDGGGIHLRGPSSCGKTTVQRVATSVWRSPARVGSWRVTANGLEDVARVSNATLLSLDEIAE